MIKRKNIDRTYRPSVNTSTDIIALGDFFDALLYLGERELAGAVELSVRKQYEGFINISSDLTARLFARIAEMIPGALLDVATDEEELKITVTPRGDDRISDQTALKIAKSAHLAGFSTAFDDERITLHVEIRVDRALAVYAVSKATLLEIFKKYF